MKSYIGQICYLKFPKAERWIKLSDFEKGKKRYFNNIEFGKWLDKQPPKSRYTGKNYSEEWFVECFGVEK